MRRRLKGRWRGRWQHGRAYDYALDGDRLTSSGGASVAFAVEDGSAILRYATADPSMKQVDRFTPAGPDRLLLESWPTWDEFKAGKPPRDFGIAARVAAERP